MNKKTLESLKAAVVLTVICIVAALLLSVVNLFAAPEIERVESEKQLATLKVVLPDAKKFGDAMDIQGAPKTVKAVYEEQTGQGYALLCTAESGYHTMTFSIGIDEEGRIAGIEMTSVFYSAGDSGKEGAIEDCLGSYIGADSAEGGKILSGVASKSSAAMKGAVADAIAYVKTLKGGK